MEFLHILDLLIWYFIFLMSTTFHEAAHAAVAMWGGDYTAYSGGQVSLDPLPHIKREPMGMVLFPLIFLFTLGFPLGWASAPYDPIWARSHHRRAALMALAGPMANLSLVIISGLILKIGLDQGFFPHLDYFRMSVGSTAIHKILSITFYLNLILFVFNLMPLPGFDGGSAVSGLFDRDTASKIADFMSSPTYNFLSFIVAYNLFPVVFKPIVSFAYSLIL